MCFVLNTISVITIMVTICDNMISQQCHKHFLLSRIFVLFYFCSERMKATISILKVYSIFCLLHIKSKMFPLFFLFIRYEDCIIHWKKMKAKMGQSKWCRVYWIDIDISENIYALLVGGVNWTKYWPFWSKILKLNFSEDRTKYILKNISFGCS